MKDPLVWVDLEMTGLDPEHDVIVEIATMVTDGTLEALHEGPDLVMSASADVLGRMTPVVRDMHTASGLLAEVQTATMTVEQAEAATLEFVTELVPEARSAPLAGNSIHADRVFLRRFMPTLEGHLHYRNVDVSTIKELARRWYPGILAAAPQKGEGHRALADIRESIEELRYYRRTLFR